MASNGNATDRAKNQVWSSFKKNKHKFVHISCEGAHPLYNPLCNVTNYIGISYGQEQKFTLKMAPKVAINGPTLMQNVFSFFQKLDQTGSNRVK